MSSPTSALEQKKTLLRDKVAPTTITPSIRLADGSNLFLAYQAMMSCLTYVHGSRQVEPYLLIIMQYEASEKVDPGVHRAILLDILARHVPAERIHFHKRCARVTQSPPTGPVTIFFQDGSIATADVVLGADGIKSAVRRFLTDSYGEEHDPYLKFSKNVVYRTLIPTEKAEAAGVQTDFQERPICFVGKNKHLIVFAIRGGTQVSRVTFLKTVR